MMSWSTTKRLLWTRLQKCDPSQCSSPAVFLFPWLASVINGNPWAFTVNYRVVDRLTHLSLSMLWNLLCIQHLVKYKKWYWVKNKSLLWITEAESSSNFQQKWNARSATTNTPYVNYSFTITDVDGRSRIYTLSAISLGEKHACAFVG